MIKYRVLDISETNLANFGTDLEKNIKHAAAEREPAWKDSGKTPGIEIWRVEQFKIVPWPKKEYGKFYSGDSYIVLYTYKKKSSDALHWHIHFWLGAYTSQDEAGTAAYKTVELDDHFHSAAIQYREIQGYESDLFRSYFKGHIIIMEGGIETGFRHVEPEKYRPRLLQLHGKKTYRIFEVEMTRDSLNSSDVFILDAGLKVYNWNGSKSRHAERFKGAQIARAIAEERNGVSTTKTLDEGDSDDEDFWGYLGGHGPIKSKEREAELGYEKRLLSLSDADGTLIFKEIATGDKIKRSLLDTNDVYILDTGFEIYVWIGQKSSIQERRCALQYAHDYLIQHKRLIQTPICKILEGGENEVFEASF